MDFDDIFDPLKRLKTKRLSGNSPCNECPHAMKWKVEWEHVSACVERPAIKECEDCIKRACYLVDCLTKLAWYENNDKLLPPKGNM